MAKPGSRRSKRAHRTSRTRAARAGWTRKNVSVDQRKLDAARRALGADTETETIDRALDFVAFRGEIARGIAAMRRVGGVAYVWEGRRPT